MNYEYEVGAVCGDFESPYSALGTLKTMEAQTPLYDCGAKPKGQLNTNQEPLPELKVGDKVHTLTVEVTITKVTGGNGTFSGEAEARLKIFNKALMSLVFKDIRVNKDYWLIGGYFEAVNGGVELPKAVEEGLDVLGDVLDESKGGGTSNDYKTSPPDVNTFVAQETITIPDGIQTIIKDERTGIVTVTDTKGVKHDLPRGKDVAVADENGRGALVNKNGQITNTTAEQAKAAGKREYGFSVVFEKAPESKAGFDKYDGKTTALKNTYQKIEEYIVPWKAISTGTDVVKGNLSIGTAKDLIFEQEGARLTYNEFTDILTVNSVPAGSTAQVIVKEKTGDKEKIRGKLNIAGYAPISKTVHIVPVNNATCTISEADLKTYLDNVYGQALVSWQVDKKNKIDVSFTGDFDDGGSGLLSTYTGDMRKVINAYGSMEPEHYYIFLIERGKTKTGYMPRGKQAGFVFLNNQSGEDIKHTIAHELGHGAFTLRHPFAEYPTVTEKSTDNLMDYAGGNHLYKWQWDQIHNPVAVIGLFEGDSEGERKVNFIEDYGEYNISGNNEILQYLLSKKSKEMDAQLKAVDYNTSNDKKFAARVALEGLLALGSNLIIGDENEPKQLIEKYIYCSTMSKVLKNHEKLMEAIKKDGMVGDSFKKALAKVIDVVGLSVPFLEVLTQLYIDIYNQTKGISSNEINLFKDLITQVFNDGINPFSKFGKQELLINMSNTQLKKLIKLKRPTLGKKIGKIIADKENNIISPYLVLVEESLNANDLKRIVQKTDDITIAKIKSNVNNFEEEFLIANKQKGIIFKIEKALNITGDVLDFIQLANTIRTIDENDYPEVFSNIISLIPVSGAFAIALIGEMVSKDLVVSFNQAVWDASPMGMITEWNSKWRHEKGIVLSSSDDQDPGPIYFIYTDEKEKYNPYVVPTSILILDRTVVANIFSYVPKFIDFTVIGARNSLVNEGKSKRFIPARQCVLEMK